MISIDLERCTECGICIRRYDAYCIIARGKRPVIRREVCNLCQRCISICPELAITMDGVAPRRIEGPLQLDPRVLEELMARRRSTKRFKPRPLPWDTAREILRSASYAPNQHKNISLLAVDHQGLIDEIDRKALGVVRRWHRILFGFRPATWFFSLFVPRSELDVIRIKMEYDCVYRKHVIKEHAPFLVLALGDPSVPVTEASAQYLMANVILMAEARGVGSCLMDSLKLTLNSDRRLRRKLGLARRQKVLAVLILGYSDENVRNVPQGYEVPVYRNCCPPLQGCPPAEASASSPRSSRPAP
jgi:nitroreductase/NAD-dependent dihydropyrimidine dehydrogenase PreA subunit